MLSWHLFDFVKVAALNSPNGADVPLITYSINQSLNKLCLLQLMIHLFVQDRNTSHTTVQYTRNAKKKKTR